MSTSRHGTIALTLSLVAWPLGLPGDAHAAKQGVISGASHVNVRSGPSIDQPAVAVLREGEKVRIEVEGPYWAEISLPDGRKGFVHKTLVQPAAAEAVQEEPAAGDVVAEEHEELQAPTPAPQPEPPGRTLPAATRSAAQTSWELYKIAGVAIGIFILGWILGGNYYLQRDQTRRTKLRF